MPEIEIRIKVYMCSRCGHLWESRRIAATALLTCPDFNSPYWNTMRTRDKKRLSKLPLRFHGDNHLYFVVSIIFTIFKLFNLDILDKPYNHLYTCCSSIHILSLNQEQKVISRGGVPVVAIGALIAIALFSLWAVGYDVGQIFSIVQGKSAYDTMWLHEFVHDIRHESGFPCH